MEWWQIVLSVAAAVIVGITAGVFAFYLYYRFTKRRETSLSRILALLVAPKSARQSLVAGEQQLPVFREIFAEIEHNRQIVLQPLKEGLQLLETQAWDSAQSDVGKLPEDLLSEMIQVYSDVRMVNGLVRLSLELGYRTPDLEDNYIDLCASIAERLGKIREVGSGPGLITRGTRGIKKEAKRAAKEKARGEAQVAKEQARKTAELETLLGAPAATGKDRELVRGGAQLSKERSKGEVEEERKRKKTAERIAREQAKREAWEAEIRVNQEAEAIKEREKEEKKAIQEEAKAVKEREKEEKRAAKEEARRQDREAKEQTRKKAELEELLGTPAETRRDEGQVRKAEQATLEQAKQEAEEATEREKAAREQAKREADEAKIKAKQEAEEATEREKAAREQEKREAEGAKIKAKQEAEAQERKETGEGVSAGLYEGRVTLSVMSPIDFGRLRMLENGLRQVANLSVVMVGGSADKGTTIIVSAKVPIPLITILRGLPHVEQVIKDGEGIRIKLRTE